MNKRKNQLHYVKTKNSGLEKKKVIFFQVGLIASLAMVLLAFEWKKPLNGQNDLFRHTAGNGPEIMIPVTVQKKKPPVKPKPVVKPVILEVIDDNEMDDAIEISVEVTDETVNNPDLVNFEEPDEPEDPEIWTAVQFQPEFPGGLKALYKFLSDNLEYPRLAKETGIQGTVYTEFVVTPDGSISDIKVLRPLGGGCTEEAIRVLKLMPKWKPGIQRTKKVHVRMSLPIVFRLME